MSRVKEVVVGTLLALIISEAFDVFGVKDKIRESLEGIESGLQNDDRNSSTL